MHLERYPSPKAEGESGRGNSDGGNPRDGCLSGLTTAVHDQRLIDQSQNRPVKHSEFTTHRMSERQSIIFAVLNHEVLT